jgi:hypothetical protein
LLGSIKLTHCVHADLIFPSFRRFVQAQPHLKAPPFRAKK